MFTVRRLFSSSAPAAAFEHILVETLPSKVAVITLNRPKALNALSTPLLNELRTALRACQADSNVGCVVLTGSAKAFAAGADIKEMATQSYMAVANQRLFAATDAITAEISKPIVAAVAGYALGGGCELAMMCDFILAADNAQFGQPEIKLGTIPGIGGTQRLTKLVGKAKAMDMVLTGRMMGAAEAEKAGLVARVVPADKLLEEAVKTAATIAGYSQPIVAMAKECVNVAENVGLAEGLRFERRLFYSTFATKDQKEGMAAFAEKRNPQFVHE